MKKDTNTISKSNTRKKFVIWVIISIILFLMLIGGSIAFYLINQHNIESLYSWKNLYEVESRKLEEESKKLIGLIISKKRI